MVDESSYDVSGLPTLYLLLTFTILTIIYVLFKLCIKEQTHFNCIAKECHCNSLEAQKPYKRYFYILTGLIVILGVLINFIYKIKMSKKVNGYNPYDVLGIEEGTSIKTMKKAYKKKIRKFNNDLKKAKRSNEADEVIKETENNVLDLNKAYQFISDPSYFKSWLENEHDVDKLLAIPALVGKSPNLIFIIALCLFFVVFKIILFFLNRKDLKNSLDVFYSTFHNFNKNLPFIDSRNPSVAIVEILTLISQSKDFEEFDFSCINLKKFEELMKYSFGEPLPIKTSTYAALQDFLFRLDFVPFEMKKLIQKKVISILSGFKQIALTHKSDVYLTINDLERMFVQALPSPDNFLLQFPYYYSTQKIKNSYVSNIKQLLLNSIKDTTQQKAVLNVYDAIPKLQISGCRAYTIEEGYLLEKDKSFILDKSFNSVLELKVSCSNLDSISGYVHAYHLDREASFTVFYSINGQIQENVKKIYSLPQTVKFTLPEYSGNGDITVCAISNDYLGFDDNSLLKVKFIDNYLQASN